MRRQGNAAVGPAAQRRLLTRSSAAASAMSSNSESDTMSPKAFLVDQCAYNIAKFRTGAMELRAFRYFVAVLRSTVCARRTPPARRAASPVQADPRHETELGVTLFQRLPRGVRLTSAGEAFLADARGTLEAAGRAMTSARSAGKNGASDLELRTASSRSTPRTSRTCWPHFATPPERRCTCRARAMRTPITPCERDRSTSRPSSSPMAVAGFDALRIVDCTTKGVLLPATTRSPPKRRSPWQTCGTSRGCTSSPQRWPGFSGRSTRRCGDGGLVPLRRRERPKETPSANMQIAAEKPGRLRVRRSRPGTGPRRPPSLSPDYRGADSCWIALVWRANARRSYTTSSRWRAPFGRPAQHEFEAALGLGRLNGGDPL